MYTKCIEKNWIALLIKSDSKVFIILTKDLFQINAVLFMEKSPPKKLHCFYNIFQLWLDKKYFLSTKPYFFKYLVTLKTGVMAAENSALPLQK